MRIRRWLSIVAMNGIAGTALACPPTAIPASRWAQFEAREFAIDDAAEMQRTALAMLDCLADPNPNIRDGIAFESLASWMRSKRVSPATARTMLERLTAKLDATGDGGFGPPFAALVLSEVARMDRVERFLTNDEHARLVRDGARYVAGVRDYRGFDDREGWRHGVAHGADLLMQLAINTRTTKPQLDTILSAVATQIAPSSSLHFYVYGESERLARPVLYAAERSLHSDAEWATWLASVASPAPLASWREAYSTQAGLARRHNVRAFLSALRLTIDANGAATTKASLLKALDAALAAM